MIGSRFKTFLYEHVFVYLGLLFVRLLSSTYRLKLVDTANESDVLNSKGAIIYASWHQRFFPGITFFSRRKPIAIMISQSRDGEMVARIVKALGWYPVRGSSTRGGTEALTRLKALAKEGYKIGHIVDGPRGPFGKIKPGLLRIAKFAEVPVVPTITSAQSRWIVKSWDQFMIPKPFSRVIMRFGSPIEIPADLSDDEFEAKRTLIEHQMEELYLDTDRIWNDPKMIKSIFG